MSGYYPYNRRDDDEYTDLHAARAGGEAARGSVSSMISSTLGRDSQQAPGYGTGGTGGRTDVPLSFGYGGATGTGRDVPQSAGYQSMGGYPTQQQPGTLGPDAHQLPASAHQLPAYAYQQPANAYQQPANAYQQPAYAHQHPANAHQPGMYAPQPSAEFQPMRATYPAATTGIGGGMAPRDRPVPPARTVMVDILEGRNLPNVELIGKVDPYCILLAGSDKIKTRVHKDAGTNLTFNDTAELYVASGVDDLLLEVWDYNHVRGDKLMGRGRVSLADSKLTGRVKDTWVELHGDRGRTAGEVHVKIAPRY